MAAVLLSLPSLPAQSSSVLTVKTPPPVTGQRNSTLTARVTLQLRSGYHVNSSTPADEYLIPLKLSWDGAPLETIEVAYPTPHLANYSFSKKPVSIYSGQFDVITRFRVPATAPLGPLVLAGKLRYQACNDSTCLPPKTVDVKLPVEIRAR
jgi:DsbC/DsbD-like thiol-disulfide interchange protein